MTKASQSDIGKKLSAKWLLLPPSPYDFLNAEGGGEVTFYSSSAFAVGLPKLHVRFEDVSSCCMLKQRDSRTCPCTRASPGGGWTSLDLIAKLRNFVWNFSQASPERLPEVRLQNLEIPFSQEIQSLNIKLVLHIPTLGLSPVQKSVFNLRFEITGRSVFSLVTSHSEILKNQLSTAK